MPIGVKILGKKLAQLRRDHHLNQSTVAARAKMSLENVKRLEKSEVVATDRENIPLLAAALGLEVDAFEASVLANGASGDSVTVTLAGEVYRALEAKAEALGVTVEAWIADAVADPVTIIKRTLPPDAASPSAPASDPPAGTPRERRKRRKRLVTK
jgi:transcriptional regulator with XRE-family HTH domain